MHVLIKAHERCVIMPRELKRKLFEIVKTENGLYELKGKSPKGFVASGGGAKGIYYAPLIRYMEEQGMLKTLTHVSGASAGAMTGSLLAVGINSQDFTNLVSNLNIIKLLDNQGFFRLRARGERFRNTLEVIYVQQIKARLEGVFPPLKEPERGNYFVMKQKIKIFENILEKANVTINSVEDIIKLSQDPEALDRLDKEFAESPKNWTHKHTKEKVNPRITFADLEHLRAILPEEKQHLIKNLSVVTTNQHTKQRQVHNAKLTGGEALCEVVQQSGAHPLLFTPVINADGHSVADGAILDNMPSDILIDQFGMHPEEIICAKVEEHSGFNARIQKAKQHAPVVLSGLEQFLDSIANVMLGGYLFQGGAEVLNREKVYYHLDNMIYLNSGAITAISTSLTPEQRQEAIDDGYKQVTEFFGSRVKRFANPLLPMLYLGKEQLEQTLTIDEESLQTDTVSKELFKAAAEAQVIFHLQCEIISNIQNNSFDSLPFYISQINELLTKDAKLNKVQTEQAMALILKQINYQSEGGLERYLIAEIEAEDDANQVTFFTQLLNLLYKAIEWIFSLFQCNTSENQNVDNQSTNIQQIEPSKTLNEIYTARKIYSMFAEPEPVVVEEKPTEEEADDNRLSSCFAR